MIRNHRPAIALTIALGSVLACSATGPATLRRGRMDYNVAVQQTNKEQLLLNLVRMRYRDTPFFLEVASVSTNYSFAAAAGGSALLPRKSPNILGAEVGLAVEESPTVTYTPLQGDEFVRRMLAPIELATLPLLYHSGWSIDRILRVTVQSLNGVPNARSASGPTPDRAPEFRHFLRAAKLLRDLQVRGHLELARRVDGDALALRFAPAGADGPEARELREILNLPADRSEFTLSGHEATEPGHIAVEMRSLTASAFYLSQSVQPPKGDEEAGRVTVTLDAAGEPFDWRELTGDLLQIRSSSLPSWDSYVSTRCRGSWFSIDDSDLNSKSTFALLSSLFNLQAGHVESVRPILTLPVAR